jgi:D-lactate dehydrogenase (cytochrome)
MLIRTDPDSIRSYLEDSSNLKGGHADKVVVPSGIAELSSVLREANAARTPVTVSGGGTGTTGSRIPFGGIVISLEKFNRIVSVSPENMSATVEAGVLVEDLKKACESKGLFYTCHPTEGTATVGGTVATNASGARSFRYGPTRRYVRRIKMALADGEIVEVRRGETSVRLSDKSIRLPGGRVIAGRIPSYRMPDVKCAAGYFAKDGMDLVDLFIGQEGTLSVIVEAEVGVVKKPERIFSAFAFFRTEEDAWAFAGEARGLSKRSKGDVGAIDALSIEYFGSGALDLLRLKSANVPETARGAIFFEQEAVSGGIDRTAEAWLSLIARHNGSPDETWAAMNEKEADGLSALRYSIPESVNDIVRRNGYQKLSTDIAVPEARFIEMMKHYRDSIAAGGIHHVVFGHIGECHVHANLLPRSPEEAGRAGEMVLGFVRKGVALGGTVSAEHGIGKIKTKYLEEMYGRAGIEEMARLKKAFDPTCILGLDNLFPKELL